MKRKNELMVIELTQEECSRSQIVTLNVKESAKTSFKDAA